jgi:hypothetical protein
VEKVHRSSRFWTGVKLALGAVVLLTLGGWLLNTGIEALSAGEMTVRARGSPPRHISAHADPWRFRFEVWCHIVFGAALVLVAAGLPLALMFSSTERRRRMLDRAAMAGGARGGPRVPGWLAFLIIAGVIAAFLVAAGRVA